MKDIQTHNVELETVKKLITFMRVNSLSITDIDNALIVFSALPMDELFRE